MANFYDRSEELFTDLLVDLPPGGFTFVDILKALMETEDGIVKTFESTYSRTLALKNQSYLIEAEGVIRELLDYHLNGQMHPDVGDIMDQIFTGYIYHGEDKAMESQIMYLQYCSIFLALVETRLALPSMIFLPYVRAASTSRAFLYACMQKKNVDKETLLFAARMFVWEKIKTSTPNQKGEELHLSFLDHVKNRTDNTAEVLAVMQPFMNTYDHERMVKYLATHLPTFITGEYPLYGGILTKIN